MANSALGRGEIRRAANLYAESLSLCRTIGDRATMANIALLERTAELALQSAQTDHAARLLGASEAFREELGAPIMPYLRPILDRCLEQIGARMVEEALHTAMAEARSWSTDATVREALSICQRVQSVPDLNPPRKHDVVPSASSHNTSR